MTAITEFFTQETTQETTSEITQETTRKTTLILRLKWHNLPEKEYKNRREMMNLVDFIPSRGYGSVARKMLYAKWLACVRLPLMLIEERSADGSCVLGIVQKKNYPEKKSGIKTGKHCLQIDLFCRMFQCRGFG
jgi:hypothetical protein